MTFGEHPPFSPDELAEIRRLVSDEWYAIHKIKNETAVPEHRDKLTERLLTLERIEEKTRETLPDPRYPEDGNG